MKKLNKLNDVASIFESNTLASFEMCLEDTDFKDLVIAGITSNESIKNVAEMLCNYANENLI